MSPSKTLRPRLLTPSELAEMWRCSVDLIYKEINNGRLAAARLGGWKIDEQDAARYVEANKKQPVVRRRPGPKRKPRQITKGV